jgi:hypothetical protein
LGAAPTSKAGSGASLNGPQPDSRTSVASTAIRILRWVIIVSAPGPAVSLINENNLSPVKNVQQELLNDLLTLLEPFLNGDLV